MGYIISHLHRAPNDAFYNRLGLANRVVCLGPNHSPRDWLNKRVAGSWEILRLVDGNFNLYRNSYTVTRHIREIQYRFRRRRRERHVAARCFWALGHQPLTYLAPPFL